MIATALVASLGGKSPERSDPDYTFQNFVTWAQCVIDQSWGCIIQQMCTDGVMTTTWRPFHFPCNIWYTINPSPSG